MNIYAEHGHKVVAKHLDWGWESDKINAKKHLKQDKEYTVDFTIVHSSSTEVYLVEVPNVSFNSVHFVDATNNTYFDENDGYGVVGFSFECFTCSTQNRFVDEEESRHYCNKCGAINTFKVD